MRVIVVGSGAAGLMAAYRAAVLGHDVALVTKADLPESNTRYAQGGVAAVMFPDDTVDAHVADTLVAGAGLCDPGAVRLLCTEGPDRLRDLLALGLELDRVAGPGSPLARGREAAHSADRVLHAHGDATGLSLEIALIEAVRSAPVEVYEHAFLRDLLVEEVSPPEPFAGDGPGPVAFAADGATSSARPETGAHPGVEPGRRSRRVVGVDIVHTDGSCSVLRADAVVLATGGAGQLFAHTTNPDVTTGDGVAAALRAGAALADLEFYQFHPTALAVAGTPLISEAVRGEGAVLRDGAGHRFMLDVHPDAELAPRDVVARGIAEAMATQGGAPVFLDGSALGAHRLARRFPGITTTLHANGFSWDDPIPVTPAAHYWMGGIRTDIDGRTSLPGLFAVGEAACTGVHGANRLASNSLLEALVFGWRAADALSTPTLPDLSGTPALSGTPESSGTPALSGTPESSGTPALSGAQRAGARPHPDNPGEPRTLPGLSGARRSGARPHPDNIAGVDGHGDLRTRLKALLWERAGIVRDEAGLRGALADLDRFVDSGPVRGFEPTNRDQTHEPVRGPIRDQSHESARDLIRGLEDRNLVLLGRAVVAAALARTESRGGHARSDFPDIDPAQATSTAWRLPQAALVPAAAPAGVPV